MAQPITPFIFIIALTLSGCTNYTHLHKGEYGKLQPQTLVEAGNSKNPELALPVAKLLTTRLNKAHTNITEEQAIEAVIALGRIGTQSHTPLLIKLVKTDSSSDVRFFAANALKHLNSTAFTSQYKAILGAQKDTFVISHLQSLKKNNH